MDGDIGFGYRQRKRPHAQLHMMEHDGSLSPTWFSPEPRLSAAREVSSENANPNGTGPSHRHVASLRLPNIGHIGSMPGPHHQRYPGNGFDYRRPANMTRRPSPSPVSEATVIDLTNDDAAPSVSNAWRPNPPPQRAPRFARNIMDTQVIIDLDDEEERVGRARGGGGDVGARRPVALSDSPEIEIVSSRPVPPHLRRNLDDELEITGSAPVPEERRRTPRENLENLRDGRWHELNRQNDMHVRLMPLANMPNMAPTRAPRIQAAGHGGAYVAPLMDYDIVAFDMGRGIHQAHQRPPPPPPTYNAPEAPIEGFTRTVKEEDTLVCPNCGDELCTGESDVKKQVWIIKGCGHVYCGECTTNRSSSRKGKERVVPVHHRPFKQCVVIGCGTKVSNRSSMIQIFL